MPIMNLQDSFRDFCKKNNFEINKQQIEIIGLLDTFLNNKKTFLSRFFKKKEKLTYLIIR